MVTNPITLKENLFSWPIFIFGTFVGAVENVPGFHTHISFIKTINIIMSSSSISAFAKEGIDKINRGKTIVDLNNKYVEIICCCLREEEIIIIRGINDDDAAAIADVLKTNTTLQDLRYVMLFYSLSFVDYFENIF
jgi:hypothetical protein